MKNSSIPVIYDEAESKSSKRNEEAIGAVVGLARLASDNFGHVQKGTPSGKGIEYTIRSMFLFVSIATGVKEEADESRITTIETHKVTDKAWEQLEAAIYDTFTQDSCGEHRKAIIGNLPELVQSILVFKKVFVSSGCTTRDADQLAPMAAGWWHIAEDEVISEKSAADIVSIIKDSEMRSKELDQTTDSRSCLETIMSIVPRYHSKTLDTLNLAGLIKKSLDDTVTDQVVGEATQTLTALGIRVDPDRPLKAGGVFIHVHNTEFMRIMRDTQYNNPKAIISMLCRLPGVEKNRLVYIGTGVKRCVVIPIEHVIEEEI